MSNTISQVEHSPDHHCQYRTQMETISVGVVAVIAIITISTVVKNIKK